MRFTTFRARETAEIHLATNFQNMLFDGVPAELREEIYGWLRENAKDERKAGDSDEQFFYKTRKKALGPFKNVLWKLPAAVCTNLAAMYDAKFEFLFTQLGIAGTKPIVARTVKPLTIHRPRPGTPGFVTVTAAPDDATLSD